MALNVQFTKRITYNVTLDGIYSLMVKKEISLIVI